MFQNIFYVGKPYHLLKACPCNSPYHHNLPPRPSLPHIGTPSRQPNPSFALMILIHPENYILWISLRYVDTYAYSIRHFNTNICHIHIFTHNSTGVNVMKKSIMSKFKENFNMHILSLFTTFYAKYLRS